MLIPIDHKKHNIENTFKILGSESYIGWLMWDASEALGIVLALGS